MKIQNLIFILLIVISLTEKSGKKKQNKPHKEKYNSKDEIENLYNWAKKNNIFISEKLHLNKNIDASHNFYYFTSNSQIPNNTLLLRVPYDIMISQSSLENHFQEKRSKKFAYLWDKIIENKNPYISYFSTKQLFYMSILIEDAINKKKGALYNKYKPYFDMYEYINMDIFPVFYDEEERYFLAPSSFGNELSKAVESLKEEYYIINNDLQITTSIQDNFLKYRVLALANSLSFNNTKLNDRNDFNESIIVPFIDCFRKVVLDYNASAEYKIVLDNNDNKYYVEIRSKKDIEKNSEINLKWRKIPNEECLIYYGFIEKGNYVAPKMEIILFNNMFRKDLGVDEDRDLRDIMQRSRYELNTEFFNPDVVRTYKNISKLFDKYKDKPEGFYEMMRDNLNYYLELYDEQYTDGKINLYIKGNDKRKYIKSLMKIERLVVQKKIDYVNDVINDIKTGVATPPEDL
jgi:hypothetical protein